MGRRLGAMMIFGGFAAAVGAALYPIYYHPMAHIQQYSLKVWSDPFSRK
ncbi:hypothetical protein GDO78_011595 [Eleutherodactylus coqui]|uniref:Small integral membrane protein 20 n=1 Tax=Eleutherodactylus coqui TaxID=57060 RepID=A0A8J6F303_ELECQ|nr:hypothetical protein GDO78_011595 [Eleutherodactylus coqui]